MATTIQKQPTLAKTKKQRKISETRKTLNGIKEEEAKNQSLSKDLNNQITLAKLEVEEQAHKEILEKFENGQKAVRMEDHLSNQLYDQMVPLSNKVQHLSRLLHRVMEHLDKHENQVDIIEQALFGRSRAMNKARAEKKAAREARRKEA